MTIEDLLRWVTSQIEENDRQTVALAAQREVLWSTRNRIQSVIDTEKETKS